MAYDMDGLVPEVLDGDRLDRAVRALVPGLSWSAVRRLIAAGRVRLGGQAIASASHKVRAGEPLSVKDPDEAPRRRDAGGVKVPSLYEDASLIAFDKPPGLPTSPTGDKMAPDLLSLARHLGRRIYMVHRLDAGTSGVVIFAKTRSAQIDLLRLFRARRITKTYLAITAGAPEPRTGVVRTAMGRPGAGKRRSVSEGGRMAISSYHTLGASGDRALVELRPATGRTHQLRIHMAELGCPILGDEVYGSPRVARAARRLMLHALRLEFAAPRTGQLLRIEAEPPRDFERACRDVMAGRDAGPRPGTPDPPHRWREAPPEHRHRARAPRA